MAAKGGEETSVPTGWTCKPCFDPTRSKLRGMEKVREEKNR